MCMLNVCLLFILRGVYARFKLNYILNPMTTSYTNFLKFVTAEPINTSLSMGFLHRWTVCPSCDSPGIDLVPDTSVDGFMWECSNCKGTKSIREASVFSPYNEIPLDKMFLGLFYLCDSSPVSREKIVNLLEEEETNDLCSLYSTLVSEYYAENYSMLGGENETVEAKITDISENAICIRPRTVKEGEMDPIEDESAPNNMPNILNDQSADNLKELSTLCIELFCRETGDFHIQIIKEKSPKCVNDILVTHVKPGSRIITDKCDYYNQIPDQFNHSVIHGGQFVDKDDPTINRQHAKITIGHFKMFVRKTRDDVLDDFTEAYREYWMKKREEDVYGELLRRMKI